MSRRYASNAAASHRLSYTIVWCPKYRRPVLTEPYAARLETILRETAESHGWRVLSLTIMPEQVHIHVETGPTYSITEIVNLLKGRSSRTLREEYPALKSRLPTLWTRSYFAATTGTTSQAEIERFVEAQKGI